MATISAEEAFDAYSDRTGGAFDGRHGGAYDRGSADAYYGRAYDPHYFVGDSYYSKRVTELDGGLTPNEIVAYKAGFDGEPDRKQWCSSGE